MNEGVELALDALRRSIDKQNELIEEQTTVMRGLADSLNGVAQTNHDLTEIMKLTSR